MSEKMSIEKLKEKVLGAIEEAGKYSLLSIVTEIFSEYEQAQKCEEPENNYCDAQTGFVGTKKDVILKRRTQEEMNTHIIMTVENNRQNHAKEIEVIKKEIAELHKLTGDIMISYAKDYKPNPKTVSVEVAVKTSKIDAVINYINICWLKDEFDVCRMITMLENLKKGG